MPSTEPDRIAAALRHIPADDRETWVKCGMAVKSGLGEQGFDLWDEWSRTSDRYQAKAAQTVWRSFKPEGALSLGTLFYIAGEYGWGPGADASPRKALDEEERSRRLAERRAAEEERSARAAAAVEQAKSLLEGAKREPHPYLEGKGFPGRIGLVNDGKLLVPMYLGRKLVGMQLINPDGKKKFLPGQRARGAVHELGSRGISEEMYVEGYATGLSVRKALDSIHLNRMRVLVCFSAANLAKAVEDRPPRGPLGKYRMIVADNDRNGVGARYAEKTGLPWWMPPLAGYDANDWHQTAGLHDLANDLRRLRNKIR